MSAIVNNDKSPILVSILCCTYNHAAYIRQCLEGFIMQKTNFRFEAIVHDDASTDNTASIIREYAEKYPDIIKPIIETTNQYSKHDDSIAQILNNAINPSSQYIAFCEGDDYWTDPYKLQKQIDFLESHSEYVYSCHRYYIHDEIKAEKYLAPNIFFDTHPLATEFTFKIDYPFFQDWVTKTLTCIYRRKALDTSLPKRYKFYRDVHLVYHILLKGKGICHSFIGGVYRKNANSTYGSLSEINQIKTNYSVYKEFFQKTHDPLIGKLLAKVYLQYCIKSKKLICPSCINDFKALFIVFPNFFIKKVLFTLKSMSTKHKNKH